MGAGWWRRGGLGRRAGLRGCGGVGEKGAWCGRVEGLGVGCGGGLDGHDRVGVGAFAGRKCCVHVLVRTSR